MNFRFIADVTLPKPHACHLAFELNHFNIRACNGARQKCIHIKQEGRRLVCILWTSSLLKIKNYCESRIRFDLVSMSSGASRSVARQVACQLALTSAELTPLLATRRPYTPASYPSNYPNCIDIDRTLNRH